MSHKRTVQKTSKDDREEAKRRMSKAFDRAVDACGYTNEQVAALFGIDERRVRKMRSADPRDRDLMPSLADALLADHDLGERMVHELRVERLALHGAPPTITIEQYAIVALTSAAKFVANVGAALTDGAVSPMERPSMRETAAQAIENISALAAGLAMGDR